MKDELEIIPVDHVDDVLKHALTGPLTPIEWDEADEELAAKARLGTPDEGAGVVAH